MNGSELLYQSQKKHWQDQSPVFGGSGLGHDRKIRVTERRHREHDELRYSIRSAFKYLHDSFSSIRILASDFFDGTNWIGQVPTWLDEEAGKQYGVSMMYTSELYDKNKDDLPVFSSLSLESRFANVPPPGHGNDVMVYMNDDMFFASEHSVSDFWNPVIGLNLQVDHRSWVENQNPSVEDFQWDWNSEWTALRYSNQLLSTFLVSASTNFRRTIRRTTTSLCGSLRQTPFAYDPERSRERLPFRGPRNIQTSLPQ